MRVEWAAFDEDVELAVEPPRRLGAVVAAGADPCAQVGDERRVGGADALGLQVVRGDELHHRHDQLPQVHFAFFCACTSPVTSYVSSSIILLSARSKRLGFL